MKADEAYKGYLVDKANLNDVHLSLGCVKCHGGDDTAKDKEAAHQGYNRRPSDNQALCGECHGKISEAYRTSLHYSTHGFKQGVEPRFSASEKKIFGEKVFGKSCNNCHASCGDCHVRGPVIGGVSVGLLAGHKFVRRSEAKTCGACHGGRVYPEFTGEVGGPPDVHYQAGKSCMDCHGIVEMHGDGKQYGSRHEVPGRPNCASCHPESSAKAKSAHDQHRDRLTCNACHSSGPYNNCYNCHLGKGAQMKPGMILGKDARTGKVSPLRVVPTVRDTFAAAGIKQENFDALPNYWGAAPHNIKKRTDRTRSCETCHQDRKYYLEKENLIPNGSKANEPLIIKKGTEK
ncbi:MAG TPA: hypothetical protein VLL73_02985 [Desulfurivibrionaceae bacterium]|nr:hypothetical protein [Desulfurivibrionaceae bacterium]